MTRRWTRAAAMPSARLTLALAAVLAAAGCQSRADHQPHDDGHAHHGAAASAASVPACDEGAAAGPALKLRKDRIAKGVYYASRRLEVDGPFELWNTPYGPYWVVEDNFRTMSDVLGEQAIEIYGDAARGVREGDIVLDCGAHFGAFTRTALDRGAARVVAIEIAPENVQCLRRNFAAEIAQGRVVVYEKGVWHEDDTMILERKNHTWADHVAETGAGPEVAVTTIDRIVAELGLPRVDFIKMDIEGAERNAVAGAAETLRTHRPRMAVAAYHEADDLEAIPARALAPQPGYSVCVGGGGLGHGYTTLFFK